MRKIVILTIIVCFLITPFYGVMGFDPKRNEEDKQALIECLGGIHTKALALKEGVRDLYEDKIACEVKCREEKDYWLHYYHFEEYTYYYKQRAREKYQPCFDACEAGPEKIMNDAEAARGEYLDNVYVPAQNKCIEELEAKERAEWENKRNQPEEEKETVEQIIISKKGFVTKTVSVKFTNGRAYITPYFKGEERSISIGSASII